MQRHSSAAAFVLLLFFVPLAFATGPVKPEPAPAAPQVQQTQRQAQAQRQQQQQRQTAQAAAEATATAAPVQTFEVSEFNPRQSPGIAQGSFAIQGCGAAANAGGSNVGGAAFLGVGFTTPQCYDFMLAQAYAAAGAWSAACEVLNASPAGKRAARRGVALPQCSPLAAHQAPPIPSAPVVPTEITVRVDDGGKACEDRVERAFKQCVAK